MVRHVGPGVEVLATVAAHDRLVGADAGGQSTPVLCRQGPVLVCAFHPELTGDRRLHALFVSMIEATRRPGPATAVGDPTAVAEPTGVGGREGEGR